MKHSWNTGSEEWSIPIPGKGLPSIAIALIVSLSASSLAFGQDKEASTRAAAEAYQRMTFMLNLDPIRWAEVAVDAERMEAALRDRFPEDARDYATRVKRIYGVMKMESTISLPTYPLQRHSARELFEMSTMAAAKLLVDTLSQLNETGGADAFIDDALALWYVFAATVEATDRKGYIALEEHWEKLSVALRDEGPLDESTRALSSYFRENYVDDFHLIGTRHVAPIPMSVSSVETANEIFDFRLPPGAAIDVPPLERTATLSELEEEGSRLFESPELFGEPARGLGLSCATCHLNGGVNPDLFIPGLSDKPGGLDVTNSFFGVAFNDRHFDHIDIPDLVGARHTAPYARDGHIETLEGFINNVIAYEFGGETPSDSVVEAIAAFVRSLDYALLPEMGPGGRLNDGATPQALRGEKLFTRPFDTMEGKSCATCHVPATHFLDGLRHAIGSVDPHSKYAVDGLLDTPTLRNSVYTAPYFHDGRMPTLESVVRWFDRHFALGFDENDIADLTAYVETIGR